MKKRSRETLLDLVNQGKSYIVFDKNVAFELLKRVDAQDAMSFAQTAGADNRYYSFVQVLRDDKIWEFWMETDLEVITGTLGSLLWDIPKDNRTSTEPISKIYYLWYRLIISAYQHYMLRAFESYSEFNGPAYKLTFVRLNEFEMKKVMGGFPELLDFRKEYRRLSDMFPFLLSKSYRLQNAQIGIMMPFEEFLLEQYPKFGKDQVKQTARICFVLFNNIRLSNQKSVEEELDRDQLAMIYSVPRVSSPSFVIVASTIAPCLKCGIETELCEQNNTERFFCNASCQDEYYE